MNLSDVYEPFYQKTYKKSLNNIKENNYIVLVSNYDYSEYNFCYIGKFTKLLFDKYEAKLIFKINECISNISNKNLIRLEIPLNAFYDELSFNSDNLINLINTKKYIIKNDIPNKLILSMDYTFDEELANEVNIKDNFFVIYDFNDKNLELAKKLINKKMENIKEKFNELNDEQKKEFIKWINIK
jgi:hypothetical protein